MPRRRKKKRTHVVDNQNAENALSSAKQENKIPKSLVIRRGKTEHEVGELVDDLRKLMLPYTALNFQEDPKNRKLTLARYCSELALPMGITHILAFSQTEQRLNLRLARTPEGPTISFRVHQFSLAKHIKALQRRPISENTRSGLHQNPPIVVTNNFGDVNAPPQIKLLRITFQNMFPAINVATVKLTDCRRVVLFHLVDEEEKEVEEEDEVADDESTTDNKDDNKKNTKTKATRTRTVIKQRVHIRHYAIKAAPVGVNRKVRRLIQSKLPNLNRVQDIADYITGQAATGATADAGAASDSEAEEDPSHVVQLAQSYSGKGNLQSNKSALKLVELGPRLSLELIKVEKGLGGGDVMYHAHVQKSPQEAKELKERKELERQLKQQRRQEQERNVERKRLALEEKRQAKRQRKEQREQAAMEALRRGGGGGDNDEDDDNQRQEDDNDGSGSDDDKDDDSDDE